jgi:hypothetical protein
MLPGKDHLRTVHYFYVRAGYFEPILRQIDLKDPAEVILSLSSTARQTMLDAMMEGDGSQRRTRKASSFGAVENHIKRTWEFFTLLKVALGQPYGVCRNLTKAKTPFLHFWSIQGNLRSPATVWNPTGVADTWCPITDLGTWVMRQDSRICVTGNCADPNLQQSPARHPVYGKLWRSIYLPDEGGQWAACDYSQQEPRLLIHYAELSGCPGAKEMADKFRNDFKADLHDETTKLAYPELVPGTPEFKKARKDKCKIIFLGLCYSMGEAKLCMSLGYPTELVMIDGKERRVAGAEGKAFLKEFNAKVPFLGDLVKKVQRVAWSRAYIITILGRHCRFPKGEKEERKALNRLIQGSAADQTKLAMVECDKAGISLQLQVHDELGFTIYSEAEAEKAADIMKNCIKLTVPSRVDIEIGPSWGGSM